MKKLFSIIMVFALVFCISGCAKSGGAAEDGVISLSDNEITYGGKAAGSDKSAPVYISNDVVYYEDKDAYDSGNPYGDGEAGDRHSAEEAAGTTVVNITQPGTYTVRGKLSSGQLRVDLGEEAYNDPDAVVTLILDGAEIECGVAPAVLFVNVYECDNGWSAETAGSDVDTAAAGANIVVADGSENVIKGSHVAKIYKDSADEKKLWKQDGAVYSYMSMNISGGTAGDGLLTVIADNEGICTELHLTVNGGDIRVYSRDDGINTNEDGVSVTAINGGTLHVLGGLGAEGDGIDSNGWLVINGGTVIASANPAADAGLDSDMGSYINGGTVVALGSTMDWPESDSEQVTVNLQFAGRQSAGDTIVLTDTGGNVVFAYDQSADEAASGNMRQYQGAVVSCPEFKTGETYNLYLGGKLTGAGTNGICAPGSVTEYTGGVKQVYTGTDVRGPGGFAPGGAPQDGNSPEGTELPQGGQRPEGKTPFDGVRPEGMEPPQGGQRPEGAPPADGVRPEGTEQPRDGQRPDGEPPADGEMPEGMEPPEEDTGTEGLPAPSGAETGGEASGEFFMRDKVNSFSGIRAEDSASV